LQLQHQLHSSWQGPDLQIRSGGDVGRCGHRGAERIELTLPEDGLGADNKVILTPTPQRTLDIYLAHESSAVQNAFTRLTSALPNLTKSTFGNAELIISDGGTIANSAFNVVLLDSSENSTLQRDWRFDAFSPLMAGFDPFGLIWYATDNPPFTEGAVHLQAGGTPLIQLDNNLLFFNIDLQRSNLFRHSVFPVIFQNLADWLDQRKGGLHRYAYTQGETLEILRASDWQGDVKIQAPNGSTTTYASNLIRLGQLSQSGLYTLETDEHREVFAVNFLDGREGALHLRQPSDGLPSANFSEITDTDSSHLIRKLLTLLAALCMLIAWFLLVPRQRLKRTHL
ncbi:MAG: hypothetical protein AAF512_23155, partial [Pseudomonadota bacterium]